MSEAANAHTFLQRAWSGWKRIARRIGDFQARLLLAVFYHIILAPFALIFRLRGDVLAIKHRGAGGWRSRPLPELSHRESSARQF